MAVIGAPPSSSAVEVEGLARRPRPRSRGRRRRGAAAAASSRAGGLVADQLLEGRGQRRGSSGGTRRAAPVRGDLGEAADGAQHHRLAEGEAGVEDAGVLGVAVGEDDEVGAAEDRRDLGVLDEAGDEADAARAPRRRAARSGSTSIRGLPTIQSSAPSTRRKASSRVSMPL